MSTKHTKTTPPAAENGTHSQRNKSRSVSKRGPQDVLGTLCLCAQRSKDGDRQTLEDFVKYLNEGIWSVPEAMIAAGLEYAGIHVGAPEDLVSHPEETSTFLFETQHTTSHGGWFGRILLRALQLREQKKLSTPLEMLELVAQEWYKYSTALETAQHFMNVSPALLTNAREAE